MKRTVFKSAHIIDGLGATYRGHMIVDGARIVALGRGDPAPNETGEVEDLGGRTVAPGFIDCHVHLRSDGNADPRQQMLGDDPIMSGLRCYCNACRNLLNGITTIRDCGCSHGADFALRRMAAEQSLVTPRLVLSGQFICMTGGHGWNVGLQADGPDELRKAARSQIRLGADNVKLIATGGILTPGTEIGAPQLSIEEMKAAVDEAKKAGKISCAHAHGAIGVKNAVLAGVDSIEHGYLMDNECIDLMLEREVYLVATSAAVRNVVAHAGQGIPTHVVEKAKQAIDLHIESFKKAHKAGVKLAMGTDSGVPFTRHGNNLDELGYLVDMGLSPMEAIQVSTLNAARLLRLDHMIGSLEPGKLADFVVIDGNPLEDIKVLQKKDAMHSVVLNGEFIRRGGAVVARVPPLN